MWSDSELQLHTVHVHEDAFSSTHSAPTCDQRSVHIDIEATVRGDSLAQCASALMNNEGLMMHLSREYYVFDTEQFFW
jgi:hypothetical protein